MSETILAAEPTGGGIEWSKTQTSFLQLFAHAAYQGDPELAERLVTPIANLLRAMVHDILTEAAERGEIRTDVDLEAATRVIHALTIAIGDSQMLPFLNNYSQVGDTDISPERTLNAMLEMVINGIGSPNEGAYNPRLSRRP